MKNKFIYFFIGTEAELMKMYKVIQEAQKRGYNCKLISNGQNDIKDSYYLQLVGGNIDIDLTLYGEKDKNASGYSGWFLKTKKLGIRVLKNEIADKNKNDILMVVHGDTVSTLMGAGIAKRCGINYAHVESGPRSYNWFSPFPEEIDRYFSSKKSVINFCPGEKYAEYADKAFKGKAVNTIYNTGIETLYDAIDKNKKESKSRPVEEPYFLLAIHRQENLLNAKYMKTTFEKAKRLSDKMKCLFIYHSQTKEALEKFGLWEDFVASDNVVVLPRMDYFSFINCVEKSEFIMADGCGNQQEMYYLGKPYLIMRTEVEEDSEGLGWNAECFRGDYSEIENFFAHYQEYKHDRIVPVEMPSSIIMNEIDEYFFRNN